MVLLVLIFVHIILLHAQESSSGETRERAFDKTSFWPFFVTKDVIALGICIFALSMFVFFMPLFLSHEENYIRANSLQTPAHIVPEWYFLSVYAILRSTASKVEGVLGFVLSISTLVFMGLLLASEEKKELLDSRRSFIWIGSLSASFVTLTIFGSQSIADVGIEAADRVTVIYFALAGDLQNISYWVSVVVIYIVRGLLKGKVGKKR
jgi:quinol-cytochrome oxidoreductase complex cytochrome b subunit